MVRIHKIALLSRIYAKPLAIVLAIVKGAKVRADLALVRTVPQLDVKNGEIPCLSFRLRAHAAPACLDFCPIYKPLPMIPGIVLLRAISFGDFDAKSALYIDSYESEAYLAPKFAKPNSGEELARQENRERSTKLFRKIGQEFNGHFHRRRHQPVQQRYCRAWH